MQRLLFIIPPFSQLNTPYPATPFLKGFLNTRGISSHQVDLGIEAIDQLFSRSGFQSLFDEIDRQSMQHPPNIRRMLHLRAEYCRSIDPVMRFLRGKNPEPAHLICGRNWLPEGPRFGQTTDLDHDFGQLGLLDRAKYLATLYLEDISDLIVQTIDPHFGFSRYAERLGRSASSFDELEAALNTDQPESLIDRIMTGLLQGKVNEFRPSLVAFSVPFPGNLYSAFKCGQWLKKNHPEIRIVMGGGFVNTELRSVSDPRVFKYVDFITLDDGEIPLLKLIEHLSIIQFPSSSIYHPVSIIQYPVSLKRTFTLINGQVSYINNSPDPDVSRKDAGIPDYSDLPLDKYFSVIEMANPMHRLWSDGRWNKLMLAHGCYWGKCTFCDVTLDYICRYEPNTAKVLCDQMEAVMSQTGHNGFHFTDEAAPPALLRDLALEIIRRNLNVAWWTNIRFEKKFTFDLCRLMKLSGCIAVSGGLEVASDRILKLINKGVTVPQVAHVAGNFTRAGIMVHAYLMYGFPTQTAQETIDSLEVVRQLFMHGVAQSGFWHQFAMTAHSPVGKNPEKFSVEIENRSPGMFANNDLIHTDHTGCDHEQFSEGLKKSLYNFMHGICFDFPLQEWFDFKTPRTTVSPQFIHHILSHERDEFPERHERLIWLWGNPLVNFYTRKKKGKSSPAARLTIQTLQQEILIHTGDALGKWLAEVLPQLSPDAINIITISDFEVQFTGNDLGDFKTFWNGPVVKTLRENGLVVI